MRDLAQSLSITPSEAQKHGIALNLDGQRRTAFELMSYASIALDDIRRVWPQFAAFSPAIAEQIEIDAKYAVYLSRQTSDVASYRRDESFVLPDDLDYAVMPGLSNEAKQKLLAAKPRTIGHAARLDGITPAALTLIVANVRKQGASKSRRAAT